MPMETYFSMISEFSENMGGPAEQSPKTFSCICLKALGLELTASMMLPDIRADTGSSLGSISCCRLDTGVSYAFSDRPHLG